MCVINKKDIFCLNQLYYLYLHFNSFTLLVFFFPLSNRSLSTRNSKLLKCRLIITQWSVHFTMANSLLRSSTALCNDLKTTNSHLLRSFNTICVLCKNSSSLLIFVDLVCRLLLSINNYQRPHNKRHSLVYLHTCKGRNKESFFSKFFLHKFDAHLETMDTFT